MIDLKVEVKTPEECNIERFTEHSFKDENGDTITYVDERKQIVVFTVKVDDKVATHVIPFGVWHGKDQSLEKLPSDVLVDILPVIFRHLSHQINEQENND